MSGLMDVLSALKMLNPSAVLVTGPQRSGTTIAAHIMANELGYRYVDENEFQIHNAFKAGELLQQGKVVLQAPGLCHIAHKVASLGVPVVMMRRDIEDIHRSEERINWRTMGGGLNLKVELWKYEKLYGITGDSDIARVKYHVWDTQQKHNCVSFDLDYETMREHPLWKEAHQRERFAPRQWSSDDNAPQK